MIILLDPCTNDVVSSMKQLHELIVLLSGTTLGGIGVVIFMVRLMWGDFKKRHHINGSSADD